MSAKRPEGQNTHVASDVAPKEEENLPASHAMHVDCEDAPTSGE